MKVLCEWAPIPADRACPLVLWQRPALTVPPCPSLPPAPITLYLLGHCTVSRHTSMHSEPVMLTRLLCQVLTWPRSVSPGQEPWPASHMLLLARHPPLLSLAMCSSHLPGSTHPLFCCFNVESNAERPCKLRSHSCPVSSRSVSCSC